MVLLELIFLTLGAFLILRFLANVLWQCAKELIPGFEHLKKYGQNQGKWAVITGGTDGIGLGFCEVLADIGWNICIISRNEQKMKKTIQNIKQVLRKKNQKLPSFKYIVADFKNSNEVRFYQKIIQQLGDTKVGILVNNVGTSDTKFIDTFTIKQIIDIINVNCISMAVLTTLLVPRMKQQKSAIINLSSFLGENPAPYSSVYSATKAFNTYFSESISLEKGLQNIDILSVRPMFVVSPLSRQKQGFTVPDRRSCARACLRELRWQFETNGYFVHRILGLISRQLPKWLIRAISAFYAYKKMIQYRND